MYGAYVFLCRIPYGERIAKLNALEWVVLITAIAGVGGTGLGGLAALVLHRDSQRVVSLLLSFAGGIMTGVVCFDMLVGAVSPEGAPATNPFLVAGSVLAGYLAIWLLNFLIEPRPETAGRAKARRNVPGAQGKYVYEGHADSREASSVQLFMAGVVMACAIALHNMPEGMVIGASYAASRDAGPAGGAGMLMAVVIGLHNIPEGMAVAVPLMSGGMSRGRAVLTTAASGAPTIIGAIIGFCLGTMSPMALSLSLGAASGAMFYVVFGELLPEAERMWRSKVPALVTVIGLLVGLLMVYI